MSTSTNTQGTTVEDRLRALRVGDHFLPDPHGGRTWWMVEARDERFIIATRQAPFHPRGDLEYTVVDLTGWLDKRYNGVGPGIIRSSLNTMGGGYDVADGGCDRMLADLQSGKWELSHRRLCIVWGVKVRRNG